MCVCVCTYIHAYVYEQPLRQNREGFGCVEFEDCLFVTGGHGLEGQVLDSVEVYNPHISQIFDRLVS